VLNPPREYEGDYDDYQEIEYREEFPFLCAHCAMSSQHRGVLHYNNSKLYDRLLAYEGSLPLCIEDVLATKKIPLEWDVSWQNPEDGTTAFHILVEKIGEQKKIDKAMMICFIDTVFIRNQGLKRIRFYHVDWMYD